jgi:choline dehydrogenase
MPPGEHDGFVIENLYNPPGQSAVVMPGYGETHYRRMLAYKRTILVGAVVPTLPNGRVALDAAGRPEITVPLADSELARLRRCLATIARAMLRGNATARPELVIAGIGGGGFVMRGQEAVPRFERWLHAFDQVALSTGHPQGGSCMSDDPRISVVDREYRLRGFANLRVCDGSLFPMAAGVNPQWTIMALAHDCGRVMNGEA